MKILADRYLYKLDELIPDGAELTFYDPSKGFPNHAVQFDVLLVRTVTKINPNTLPEAGNLKFIGTATAGSDHIDTSHLKNLGIRFGRSAGCNARAVAEYVITCLFQWADTREADLNQKKVGVVGCGHTGGAVIELFEKLDIEYVAYDPPKAETDSAFQSANLNDLLSCNILTFHTPLTSKGSHPTRHMCNNEWFKHPFDLIINAARGGVLNEADLIRAFHKGIVGDFIIDVWENEPLFSNSIAENSFIATPHIAGYSREAKFRASQMVIEEMCTVLNMEPKTALNSAPFDPENAYLEASVSFSEFMWQNNQIELYDSELRQLIGLPDDEKSEKFASLRAETPTRYEYQTILKFLDTDAPIPDEFRVFNE
jgi:erythronate-4-phosphate dehydrogenase